MRPAVLLVVSLGATFVAASAQGATPATQAAPAAASAQPGNCGLIYGDSHVVSVCAPPGWVLDNTVLHDKGIFAVFYRQGLGFDDAKRQHSIMYVNVVKKQPGQTSVDELRRNDIAEFSHAKPGGAASTMKPLAPVHIAGAPHSAARTVPVESFVVPDEPSWEAVAYVGDPKTMSLVVLTSATEAEYKADYASFVALLRSYRFLSSHVTEAP